MKRRILLLSIFTFLAHLDGSEKKGPIGEKRGSTFDVQCAKNRYIYRLEIYSKGDYINGIQAVCNDGTNLPLIGYAEGATSRSILANKSFKGFKARSGSWIDQLTAIDLGKNETVVGGKGGNDQGDKLICPDRKNLVGLSGSTGGLIQGYGLTNYINSLSVWCAPEPTGAPRK